MKAVLEDTGSESQVKSRPSLHIFLAVGLPDIGLYPVSLLPGWLLTSGLKVVY